MKHLKLYENSKKLEIGNYIIVNGYDSFTEFRNFLENNIGEVTFVGNNIIRILFNLTPNLNVKITNPSTWHIRNVKFYSTSKDECEMYLQAKKYNI